MPINIFRIFIWKVSKNGIYFYFNTIHFLKVPEHIGVSRVRVHKVCFVICNEGIKNSKCTEDFEQGPLKGSREAQECDVG